MNHRINGVLLYLALGTTAAGVLSSSALGWQASGDSAPVERPAASSRTSVTHATVFEPDWNYGDAIRRVQAQRRLQSDTVFEPEGMIHVDGGYFNASAMMQPPPVDQPPVEQPPVFQPPVDQPSADGTGAAFGGLDFESQFEAAVDQVLSGRPVETLSAAETRTSASSDVGDLLARSNSVQDVNSQRRSQTAFNPNIRGFRDGQIYTQSDGAYWMAARQDLDTILNKLDPADIQDVVVIPGPYGLRYGPGFAFIDVIRAPTPRYDCPEIHNRFGLTFLTNGGQWYARDTVYGGGPNYGYRFNYGHRLGSDYEAGNGEDIPSSYKNRSAIGDIGFDLSPFQRVEFSYQRLDMTDTEYFLQFFDVDFLVTDGFNLRLIDEDPSGPWDKMVVEGWWNRTRFEGSTFNSSKRQVVDRVEAALENSPTLTGAGVTDDILFNGSTDGDLLSTGARIANTIGDTDGPQLTFGGDFRYLEQNIREKFFISAIDPGSGAFDPTQQSIINGIFNANDDSTLFTNLPRSWTRNPGVFAECSLPIGFWTTSVGARVDFVHSFVRESDLRPNSQLGTDLSQSDTLYAFYMTNEIQLDHNWTGRAGFGHAQRAPTMTERYADAIFLGVAQSGFTRVIGDPGLNKERNWQIDVGLEADYGLWRGQVGAFHSWVLDYVTYEGNVLIDPTGARLLRYVNTDLATLAGISASTEFDLTSRLTPFASVQYIEGRDQVINAPLPQIWPLEGRAGLRLHDPNGGQYWGVEFFARIVDNQDRLGTIRQGGTNTTVPLETATPGFTVWELRSYYNYSRNLSIIGGIYNVFDRTYLEHLDLRLPEQTIPPVPVGGTFFPAQFAFRPGFTPYVGLEWTY